MKTLKEFDYDLWTTEDEGKHYWARVKATGEITEIDHEVMKYLRNIEKMMRREIEDTNDRGGSDLSYDAIPVDDEESTWLEDPINLEEIILTNLQVEEFKEILTPTQLSVFEECLLQKMSIREYAALHDRNHKSIHETIEAIRKKYKKYFS